MEFHLARVALAGIAMLAAMAPGRGNELTGTRDKGMSPALCGLADVPEPGIQGEVPAGQTAHYNCGLKLVGQLPRVGAVQGAGQCAYVRSGSDVFVVDVSNPAKPVEMGSIAFQSGSETFRTLVTRERALLVTGSSVYDIRNCLYPVHLGEIQWPPLRLPGIPSRLLPHDIRINHSGTKVYASFGVWEADIANLNDPNTWTVTDHRCELAAQQPGPWSEIHRQSLDADLSLCVDATRPAPAGASYTLAASPLQASLVWPSFSHALDLNAGDTRLYVGDQAGGNGAKWAPIAKVRIIDIAKKPPVILGEVDGPGHGLDWFQDRSGREYVLHSNEAGSAGVPGQATGGNTCKRHPRPFSLGWAFEAFISDVTRPEKARNVSMLRLAINEPEFCEVRKASGRDPWVSYHMVNDLFDARFAAVSFGEAGLRIFDIQVPQAPREVAYFNHGPLVHAGISHYDAARKLLYVPGGSGFWVLEIEPQVISRLGL